MENIKITRVGNKVKVYSNFLNQTFTAYFENGVLKAKQPQHLRMVAKALKLEAEAK